MRHVWLLLFVGCGGAELRPYVEPPVVAPPKAQPEVIDLLPFMPDVVPVIETYKGRPTYAFRRGDEVFPLVTLAAVETRTSCMKVPHAPGAWVFPDGSAFAPNEGLFWSIDVVDNVPCWRWNWLEKLSSFDPSAPMVNAQSRDADRVSVPASGDRAHVATLQINDAGTLSFGGRVVARIVDPAQGNTMTAPMLDVTAMPGRYAAQPDELFFVSAKAEDVSEVILADWHGTPTTTRLLQWLLLGETSEVRSVLGFVQTKGLPLKTGATLDLVAELTDRTKEEHYGTEINLSRVVQARLSANGKSIALWPEAPAIAATNRTAAIPFALEAGGCTVQVGSATDANIAVRCETEHLILGPENSVDEDEMRIEVRDHGYYLSVDAEHLGGAGGQFTRKWLVPKRGGAPLVVSIDDIEQ